MTQTETQYLNAAEPCVRLFMRKNKDYGPSWTILRLPSITDQIFIKAERIRTLQETGESKVGDSQEGEFIAIVNYSIIALIKYQYRNGNPDVLYRNMSDEDVLERHYMLKLNECKDLMLAKTADYGDAWRRMRISSITDLILQKIYRIKQIEDNNGKVSVSEDVDANYQDILNYALFCLIKLKN